jgi:diacylglycerol O-acyltransferase / wax synthase
VWSYVDQLDISVLSDGATLADPHELTEAIVAAFVEIRSAADRSVDLTVVESAMTQ